MHIACVCMCESERDERQRTHELERVRGERGKRGSGINTRLIYEILTEERGC